MLLRRFVAILLLVSTACLGAECSPVARSFRMGFTPTPYSLAPVAAVELYDRIQRHGDVVAHHLDMGIPWTEALLGLPYHPAVEQDLALRQALTQPGKYVYLAIAPLDPLRLEPAGYWGESPWMPRPEPWTELGFEAPETAIAYANFALDMIDRFQPDAFNYGVEVGRLGAERPIEFLHFVNFAAYVYSVVKLHHPDLPVFVSVHLTHPDTLEMDFLRQRFAVLAPYTDWIGLSVYPYLSSEGWIGSHPALLPEDWLSQAQDLSPGKPLAITETGWIASDLVLPDLGIAEQSDPILQQLYLERLLPEAARLSMPLVVWFVSTDFDPEALLLGPDSIGRLWHNTGAFDGNLASRPMLARWNAFLERDHVPPQ